MEDSSQKEYEEKCKIFYDASVNAWFNTKLEKDKQLLTLSTTIVGLLVTLLVTFGISNNWELFCYGLAFTCLLTTITSILFIFEENSSYIEKLASDPNTQAKNLKKLDRVASIGFTIGIIAVIGIGIIAISSSSTPGQKLFNMSSEKKKGIQKSDLKASFYNAEKLIPKPPEKSKKDSGRDSKNSNSSGSTGESQTDRTYADGP